VHFLIEAQGKYALACGMKSLGARMARAAHRAFNRSGPVLDGRFHHRLLRTPREVRNGLAYVLLNLRKHHRARHGEAPPVALDAASSGRWFDGWRGKRSPPVSAVEALVGVREVANPRTWLLRVGWRRHGLIDMAEVPG